MLERSTDPEWPLDPPASLVRRRLCGREKTVHWMKGATAGDHGEDRSTNANDRLKARWGVWVGWSTVAAVAIHATALALTTWEVFHAAPEPALFEGRSLVLLPPAAETPSAGGVAAPAIPTFQEDEDDSELPEHSPDNGTGTDADLGDLWEQLNRRLGDRTAFVPTISEPTSEAEGRAPDDESDDTEDLDIGGQATTLTELSMLPESDSLDLGRLAELEPELALMTPSTWVLIRNPIEVEAYMRRSYTWGGLDPSARGSVSVTLWIDERGSVQWAEISESSGRQDLDEFALALFNEVAVFRPAREEGVRVSRSVSFALNFPW
jgi:TonB family protein